jgi:hypothetical protein
MVTTCSNAATDVLLTEDLVRREIEDRIVELIPPDHRQGLTKDVSVAAKPGSSSFSSFHIKAEVTIPDARTLQILPLPPYPDVGVGIDATVKVDGRIAFTMNRGLLNIDVPLTDLDVKLDLEGPDDLWKLSPAVHSYINNAEHQIVILLGSTDAVTGRFQTLIDQLFTGQREFRGVEYRFWSMRMINNHPDNSRYDFLELFACKYPRPWSARLNFVSLTITDDLASGRAPDSSGNISARVWFFLQGKSTTGKPAGGTTAEWRVPRAGQSSVPLNASGQSEAVSLAQVGANFDVGMLDALTIFVTVHDIDRDLVWCAPTPLPGQPTPKPPCPAPPARYLEKSYDLAERFGNGTHSERSVVVAGESFEVVYRIDLSCPTCGSRPPPD